MSTADDATAESDYFERQTQIEKLAPRLADVIEKQENRYGRFDAEDVSSVRLAIAAMQDELDETLEMWRVERRARQHIDPDIASLMGAETTTRARAWHATRDELEQLVCVGLRLLLELEAAE